MEQVKFIPFNEIKTEFFYIAIPMLSDHSVFGKNIRDSKTTIFLHQNLLKFTINSRRTFGGINANI